MDGSFLYRDGVFHAEGILWILGLAAMWGVPFYFCFAHMMDVAEKKADKNLIEKESESEE